MSNRTSIEINGLGYSYFTDRPAPQHLDISHCHDTYEILYVVGGEGRYIIEGSSYPISPGTLMVIRPFQYHSVQVEPGVVYERYVLNFSESHLVSDALDILHNILHNDGVSGRFYPSGSLPDTVLSAFARFESAASLPSGERALYVKMLLSEIMVLLSVAGGQNMANEEMELGARVIRYLNENIDRSISLDKLAKRFFVSKFYLCRAFKKHNGISVHGYINQKRVMYAKQLIDSGETASCAAYRVGFGDYSAFYRAYVKIVGKAPTAT